MRIKQMEEEKERLAEKVDKAATQAAGARPGSCQTALRLQLCNLYSNCIMCTAAP
jgi:hypothetical protein